MPPRLHFLARPAFDIWAGIAPAGAYGAARALREKDQLLVFSGFCWLQDKRPDIPVLIETDLDQADIETAAWAEVEVLVRLLMLRPAGFARLAEQLAASAPDAVLERLDLPRNRHARGIAKRLRLTVPGRTPSPEESIFSRAKARFQAGRQQG